MKGARIIDISPPLSERMEVWPGDTQFGKRRVMSKAEGGSCNVTTITTTVHAGAHVDAPLHFLDGGADAAGVDLDACVGPARVVYMPRKGGITREDVAALDLAGVQRLLLHTRGPRAVKFADGFAWLEPDAARYLASLGLALFGIDTFSVDEPGSKELASHHALNAGRCVILEGLDLSAVEAGDYELIALPLRMVGVDASPVRAVLRELPRLGAKRGLPRTHLRRAAREEEKDDQREAGGDGDTMPPPSGDPMRLNYLLTTLRLEQGDLVHVVLDSPANVMLLDDVNLASYTSSREFEYFGGWAEQSPVNLTPPHPGRWNVIIDTGDATTTVSASVTVQRRGARRRRSTCMRRPGSSPATRCTCVSTRLRTSS